LPRVAKRTARYCWNSTRPYVEVVLRTVGQPEVAYQLDLGVRAVVWC
jgi:hypothetical protein